MMSKLFLSLTLFGIYVSATKPPDPGEKSNQPNQNPENYLYGYSIYGKDNAVQERIEFRKGEKTQGNIVVQLPKGESVSNVQYTADEEGFHPVVRISTKNNHSEVTSHFALGEVAVNKLNNERNGTNVHQAEDTISMVLSTLFPNGIDEFMKQQRQQRDNVTSADFLIPPPMPDSAEDLMESDKFQTQPGSVQDFYEQNRLEKLMETPSGRRGRLLHDNITNLIESTRNLITNEDVLQINDAAESLLTGDYQNLQSNPNTTQSTIERIPYPYNDDSSEDDGGTEDITGFNTPIIVEDNMISSSQDVDRMYVLPPPLLPLSPSQIEILPARENFVNQMQTETEPQRNVQIVKENDKKIPIVSHKNSAALSSKGKELIGYEVKEKLFNDISPATERYKPIFSTASPKTASTPITSKTKLFVTPSAATTSHQIELRSPNDRSITTIASSTTPIPRQNPTEKTIVEVQKSINIHNMMIKQDGNYFEQHEEYIHPLGHGLLSHAGGIQYSSPSVSTSTATAQYSKPTTTAPTTPQKLYVTEKSNQKLPEIIKAESYYKPSINLKAIKSGKNVITFHPKPATIKFLGQNPYVSAETLLTPVASSYQIMSKDFGKTLTSNTNNANSHQPSNEPSKYYMTMTNLKLNSPQTLFLLQKPQKLVHIEKRPASNVLQLSRQNVGYYASNVPSSLQPSNANSPRNQYLTAKESSPIESYRHYHHLAHPYAFTYPLHPYQHHHSVSSSSSNNNNDEAVQSKISLSKGINKQVIVTEKAIDRPSQQQPYPFKQKIYEKLIEKPIQITSSPLLAAGTVTVPKIAATTATTAAAVSTVQVPLQIPIQVPIHIPSQFPFHGIHMPVAIAPVSSIPQIVSPTSSIVNNGIVEGHQSSNSLSSENKQQEQQQQQQQQHISSSIPAIGPGHQIQYNSHINDNGYDNSVPPLNYQLTFLGQDILHPIYYNGHHHHQHHQILNGNRYRNIIGSNSNSLDVNNGQFYTHIPTIQNLNHYLSANKYANNFNYNKNYFGNDFNESIKRPLSINDNVNSNSNSNSNGNGNEKVSNLIKRDEYIGPVPLKTEKSHWNTVAQSNGNNSTSSSSSGSSGSSFGSSNNAINSRRTMQHKRSYDFEKNLKVEYGFKPPMVPSVEIDEQGMPINHKND